MELELTPADSDVSVTVSLDRITDELGRQGIAEGKGDHIYLAAIALGTYGRDDYDLNRTLMEFIRNSSELNVSADAADRIEDLLR